MSICVYECGNWFCFYLLDWTQTLSFKLNTHFCPRYRNQTMAALKKGCRCYCLGALCRQSTSNSQLYPLLSLHRWNYLFAFPRTLLTYLHPYGFTPIVVPLGLTWHLSSFELLLILNTWVILNFYHQDSPLLNFELPWTGSSTSLHLCSCWYFIVLVVTSVSLKNRGCALISILILHLLVDSVI